MFLAAAFLAASNPRAAWSGGIGPELAALLDACGPESEIAVIAVLRRGQSVPGAPAPAEGRGAGRTRILKTLKAEAGLAEGPVRRFLEANGGRNIRVLWIINSIAASAGPRTVRALAALPWVEDVRLDIPVPAPGIAPASAAAGGWNLADIRAPELWNIGFTGQGVVVATLDTGVDINHPDLSGRWRGGVNSWFNPFCQACLADPDSCTECDASCDLPCDFQLGSGHGTAVMGLIVGGDAGGTAIGTAPGAQWIAAKIFPDAGASGWDGATLASYIHQGFQWVLDPDGDPDTDDAPDILNNSWGADMPGCLQEFATDIALIRASGIAVVCAAGNSGPAAESGVIPAVYPESFAVGAVDASLVVAAFSSRGPSPCDGSVFPEVIAPGVTVTTADLTLDGTSPDPYRTVDGTSFAAPHVTGAMALLLSAFPGLGPSRMETALAETAMDLGESGPDNDSGHGLIDAFGAFGALVMEFVERLYLDFLGREGDPGGIQYWTDQIATGALTRSEVAEVFLLSPEFGQTVAPVVRLYFACFLRIPDYGGLTYWIAARVQDTPLADIAGFFVSSPEFQNLYGTLADAEFVTLLYRNVLQREPDPEGLDHWLGELSSGRLSRGDVLLGFSESAEYVSLSWSSVYTTMVYAGLLSRTPDPEGFAFWVDFLEGTGSGRALIEAFLFSDEYAERFAG